MTTFNRLKNLRNTRAVRDIEDNWILKSTLWILFLGLLTGLITIAIINIKPYALLLASVSTQTAWVFAIPLLGPLFQNLSVGASTIGAILIWAPVQILECLWILIALDAKAQKAALRESIALTEELAPHRDDRNADTRRAVKRVSRIPFFFIKWAAVLALAAYTFDLIVGLKTYPIWKDWQSFGFWLKSMNPIWLNLDNARDLGIMLFSFEAMLILVVIVGQWLFYRETEET
jgi:hypothetical protein